MPTNTEIKRYYLYNFVLSLFDTGSGYFTAVYFYLHGFSAVAIAGYILTYGITCLIILKRVGWLLEKIGPQNTFRLHTIASLLKYASLILIFYFPLHQYLFFLLLQFFNAFDVMMKRIPINAYFSVYGDNRNRGSQIGIANNIQIIAGVIMPVIAGALIQKSGLILISGITTFIDVVSVFILKFDSKVKIKNPVQISKMFSILPSGYSKSFFFGKLVYPFTADLLAIYIAISLRSFTSLGIFVGLRTFANIILNHLVGKVTDLNSVKKIFIGTVFLSTLFWIIIPFAHSANSLYFLQFTLGLATLIVTIPYESAYHNLANKSGEALQYSLAREYLTQTGLVVGCILTIIILKMGVSSWWKLLPLGAIYTLTMLYITPYLDTQEN